MIINGVDTSQVFQAAEIIELHRQGKLRPIALHGYVARADADGTCRFVPWQQANRITPDSEGGSRWRVYAASEADVMKELRKDIPPIQRRTPQERTASLAEKVEKSKNVLPENIVKEVVRRRWKMGDPVSGEDVQAVAAAFLRNADKEQEKHDRKHVVRNFVKGPR